MRFTQRSFIWMSICAVALIAQANPAFAQKGKGVFAPIKDDPKLPRVLILGDSISIGYTLAVRELLKGKANVHRAPTNCGPTTRGLEQIDAWLSDSEWDVIHFNWGLHDLKRVKADSGKNSNDPTDPRQAEPEQYEANLRAMVERLKATGATLVFGTTTPVPDGGVRPHRDPEDSVRYNEIAAGIMKEHGITVNNLFAVIAEGDPGYGKPADVHFTRAGSKALGDEVVRAIRAAVAR